MYSHEIVVSLIQRKLIAPSLKDRRDWAWCAAGEARSFETPNCCLLGQISDVRSPAYELDYIGERVDNGQKIFLNQTRGLCSAWLGSRLSPQSLLKIPIIGLVREA